MAVAGLIAPISFGRVVEPQDGRGRAAVQHAPARLDAVAERREPERGALLDPGRRMQPQSRAGDHAECPLATDEQLREIGPDGGARRAAGMDGAPVGERDVEADDDVLDLPVARGVLACATTCEPTADRRQVDRLRPVPDRRVVLATQRVLEPRAEGSRPDVQHERSVVDVDDARECAEVEHDTTVHRDARATDAAAPRRRRHRDPRVVAHAQDGGHFIGRSRPCHRGGARRDLSVERPDHRERPPVAARFGDRRRVDRDVGAHRAQPPEHLAVDRDRGRREVRVHVGRGSTERDRWRRLPGRAHGAG